MSKDPDRRDACKVSVSPSIVASVPTLGHLALDVMIDEAHGLPTGHTCFAPQAFQALVVRAGNAVCAEPLAGCAEPASASVLLTHDDVVLELNGAYRNSPSPTNVLSFPIADGFPRGDDQVRPLGDIVLASGVLVRESEELGKPVAHHAQHLIVHGLLHLLGFDHEEVEDAEHMEALETRILAVLDVPSPYAEPPMIQGKGGAP